MCEYGGCQEIAVIDELTREHVLPAALTALDGAQWERVEAVRSRAGSPLTASSS